MFNAMLARSPGSKINVPDDSFVYWRVVLACNRWNKIEHWHNIKWHICVFSCEGHCVWWTSSSVAFWINAILENVCADDAEKLTAWVSISLRFSRNSIECIRNNGPGIISNSTEAMATKSFTCAIKAFSFHCLLVWIASSGSGMHTRRLTTSPAHMHTY